MDDYDYMMYNPNWSPDGEQIAFTTDYYGSILEYADVYVVPASATNVGISTLTPIISISDFVILDSFVAWSPDGDKIAFTAGADSSGYQNIMWIDVNTREKMNIANDSLQESCLSWVWLP
ncbi:MAG TPA: hypothetical protein GXX29_11760 [Firmicutes bacterium]|nr:hypothetical protein [Bacillota bacterium]